MVGDTKNMGLLGFTIFLATNLYIQNPVYGEACEAGSETRCPEKGGRESNLGHLLFSIRTLIQCLSLKTVMRYGPV